MVITLKKKIIRILILLIVSVSIIGCSKKREENALEENKTSNINQTVEIIEKNEDGTVKKGFWKGIHLQKQKKRPNE